MLVGAEESRQSRDEIAVVDDAEVVLHLAVELVREHSVAHAWRSETVVAMDPEATPYAAVENVTIARINGI